MIGLHHLKYALVPVEEAKVLSWILFKEHWEKLATNAQWVQEKKGIGPDPQQSEEIISALGLKSKGNIPHAFITPAEYDEWHTSAFLNLPCERNYGPPGTSIGAARHVILKDVQLKGIGRNLLAISGSNVHATGELIYRNALMGLIIENELRIRSSAPPLATLGVLLYETDEEKEAPRCLLIREVDSFRLSQLHPAYLTLQDAEIARESLRREHPGCSGKEIYLRVTSVLVEAFLQGIFNASLSPENLLLNGRWIDTESILISSISRYPLWIQLQSSRMTDETKVIGSWIHDLKVAITLYKNVFEALYTLKLPDAFEVLAKVLTGNVPELGTWLEIAQLPSERENLYLPLTESPKQVPEKLRVSLQKICESFQEISLYYQPKDHAPIVTYSENGLDPRKQMMKNLQKFEFFFFPRKRSLADCFELGEQIRKARLG